MKKSNIVELKQKPKKTICIRIRGGKISIERVVVNDHKDAADAIARFKNFLAQKFLVDDD